MTFGSKRLYSGVEDGEMHQLLVAGNTVCLYEDGGIRVKEWSLKLKVIRQGKEVAKGGPQEREGVECFH